MDIVATAWEDHLQMLKESEAPETIIVFCRNSFHAGAISYLELEESTEYCWNEFRKHVLLVQCRSLGMPDECRDIVIAECEQAFKAGAEAQWMVTATTEELRELKKHYEKELRRMLQ